MLNIRKHGTGSYKAVLVHGGPGAAGEMFNVGKILKEQFSINTIEPFQTSLSINGQILELRNTIIKYSNSKITIVGYSWGAWLTLLTVARYPEISNKIVLISTPPLSENFAKKIQEKRFSRLNSIDQKKLNNIIRTLSQSTEREKNRLFIKFGEIISKADNYSPENKNSYKNSIKYRVDIFNSVWNEAKKLRDEETLISILPFINIPITVIHGSYDPHPFKGVFPFMKQHIKNLDINLLDKCGHTPWIEKEAKNLFFKILSKKILE